MRFTCSLAFVLLASSVLAIAQPAPAPTPPAGPSPETRWRVQLRGQEIGHERVIETSANGLRSYRSVAEVKVTERSFRYEQTLTLNAKTLELAGYSLRSSQVQAAAALEAGGGVRLSVRYGEGKESKAGGLRVEFKGPAVVLDTLVYSHFAALGGLARKHDAAFELHVLIPQASVARKATFTPGAKRTVKVGGVARRVREGQLELAGWRASVVYDRERDQVYRVEDSQGYVARVDGWPDPYREALVRLESGAEATLTLPPASATPCAGVAIVGDPRAPRGGGVNDPARALARALARSGVASVRYDGWAWLVQRDLNSGDRERRTKARARWIQATFAGEDVTRAREALRALVARSEVARAGVLAHGTGVYAAAEIAGVDSRGRCLVLLGASSRDPASAAIDARLASVGGAQQAAERKRLDDLFGRLRRGMLPPRTRLLDRPARWWFDLLKQPSLLERLSTLKDRVLLAGPRLDAKLKASHGVHTLATPKHTPWLRGPHEKAHAKALADWITERAR